jgi:hypothetical protein
MYFPNQELPYTFPKLLGILAVGGDCLLRAYFWRIKDGIFPWFNERRTCG